MRSDLPNKGVDMNDVFDVVIVGAGSAGCALARRLTDDPSVNVALVEAGGNPTHPFIAAPTEYFKLWGTEIDWNYESIPQRGTADRRHRLPRGRVLGGTSAINGMVYLRGARRTSTGGSRLVALAGVGSTCVGPTNNSKSSYSPDFRRTRTNCLKSSSMRPRRSASGSIRSSTTATSRVAGGIA